MSLSAKHRKAIREAGPLVRDGALLRGPGGGWVIVFSDRYGREAEEATLAALNAIAAEDEAVSQATKTLLRAARRHDGEGAHSHYGLLVAVRDYNDALKKRRKR